MTDRYIDICVVTYNRLEYLRRCVWSIIMSTKVPYRLFVISDASTDGTNEWMEEMRDHSKIFKIIINEENLGTAKTLNRVIRATDSPWYVQACDDMYFHRGWDDAAARMISAFDDCGIASFWDFPIKDFDLEKRRVNDFAYYRQSSGLACSVIDRKLFEEVGGYYMPDEFKMGYFAKKFCKEAGEAGKQGFKRWKQYLSIPEYAVQMDRTKRYSQEYLYHDYAIRRNREKRRFKNQQT